FASPSLPGETQRMGTLMCEAVFQTTARVPGKWTCVGIASDTINGTHFVDCLKKLVNDPKTKGLVLIGEI
uniref:ATP-citrate synthase/succinyl-CoA ligase C-terminal domain-containing protein n=1 Tax=Physcomitrium patens TaxID=3218 RepID=A0A7I3YYM4_PHYPA